MDSGAFCGGRGALIGYGAAVIRRPEIVRVNPWRASITARVDVFKQDGTSLAATFCGTDSASLTDIVIPTGGVFILSMDDNSPL